ncbi:hypothetical protein [Cupriavidus basilensis]|uniref:hypothetical protein n=1 Tax=Cupriavidus basilensis TaxID=68895 RepID=UPI000750E829|nr:hypothetical protein [Cupriavidus basilensis]
MSAVPNIKEVAVHVRRVFSDGSEATFNATAASLQDALAAAQYLAGQDMPVTAAAAPTPAGNAQDSGSATTPKSSQASASTTSKSSGEPKPDAAPALDYEKDIKPRVLLLSKDKGREATIATLSRFGVTKATELSKEQWPEFLVFVNKVIDGEVNPEDALA